MLRGGGAHQSKWAELGGGGLAELPYPGHEHGMNHGIEILQETEVKLKEIILEHLFKDNLVGLCWSCLVSPSPSLLHVHLVKFFYMESQDH